jgi:uncharacterized protein (TIGR00645 family)
MRPSDRAFQSLIYWSRWLAAPFLVGLILCLFLLIYRFAAEFIELAGEMPRAGWHELVVGVLNLIDIALVANLVLIVVFSSYENFIGRIDPSERPDWPEALMDVDFGALKQKLLGSIVAIASIEALAWFLDLEKYPDTAKLSWVIAFPLMFVVSLLMLAVADRLGHGGAPGGPKPPAGR